MYSALMELERRLIRVESKMVRAFDSIRLNTFFR
jgi:hypothetical protein